MGCLDFWVRKHKRDRCSPTPKQRVNNSRKKVLKKPVVHQQQSNEWATLRKMFLNSPLFTNTQTTREQRWKCFFWNACCSPTPKQQTNNGDIRWFKKPVVHQRATTGKQRVPVGEQQPNNANVRYQRRMG